MSDGISCPLRSPTPGFGNCSRPPITPGLSVSCSPGISWWYGTGTRKARSSISSRKPIHVLHYGYGGAHGALYRNLKLEGIEEAPVCICVTCSRQRGGPHVLGRSTVPETDLSSTCCAIQNLWLAARAEGIGVGWVSLLDYDALKGVLGTPRPMTVVAWLCLGYLPKFETPPDLLRAGWRKRIPLTHLIHDERWGHRP